MNAPAEEIVEPVKIEPAILSARLTDEHLAELRASGLSDETIRASQIYSLRTPAEVAAALGRKTWRTGGGGIAFPFFMPDGTHAGVRVKPDNPRIPTRKGREGKPVKYDQRKGTPVAIYFPPRTRSEGWLTGDGPVLWTEGEKKALALDELGYCTIGLTGVYNAHDVDAKAAGQGWKLSPTLRAHVRIEGRDHVIAYDADAATNPRVMRAASVLAAMLLDEGASSVRMVAIPAEGGAKTGIDDYYAAHGAEAVHRLVREAQPIEPAELRPEIVISTEEHAVNAKAIRALSADPDIYQRGRRLVRVLSAGDAEPPVIAELPKAILRERLSAAANWLRVVEAELGAELVRAHPPPWTVDAVLERGEWEGIRHLAGIVEQPTLRPDGTILDAPGYDESTGLLYVDTGVEWPKVPENPTREDARRAVEALEDVVHDVPFEQPEHRSAWLAAVLTLAARNAIRGPVPMTLIDATTRGAGKGLAADLAAIIATGRRKPDDALPKTDEEFDKRATAWAMSGRQLVCFDNVLGTLGGASLCRVLTSVSIAGRRLGTNEDPVLPWRTVMMATGNNVQLGADMERRILHVRLTPNEERPEERPRESFRHPNVIEHVTRNRPALLCAALTILRAYCAAGRPRQSLTPWGSFEAWSDLVREALVWAGCVDPGLTREGLRAHGDPRTELYRALVAEWARLVRVEGGPVTAKKAIELSEADRWARLRELLEELATDRRGNVTPARLGYVLRGLRGRVLEVDGVGMAFESELDRVKTTCWTVRRTGPGPASPAPSPASPAGSGAAQRVEGRDSGVEAPRSAGDAPSSPASPAHHLQHHLQRNPSESRPLEHSAGDAGDGSGISTRSQKTCMHTFSETAERQNHHLHHLHHLHSGAGDPDLQDGGRAAQLSALGFVEPVFVDEPEPPGWLTAEPEPPPDDEPDDWTDEDELERAIGALRNPGLYGLAAGYLPGWSPALRRRADEIARELLAAELEILRRDDGDHERRAVLDRVGRVIRDRVREEVAA